MDPGLRALLDYATFQVSRRLNELGQDMPDPPDWIRQTHGYDQQSPPRKRQKTADTRTNEDPPTVKIGGEHVGFREYLASEEFVKLVTETHALGKNLGEQPPELKTVLKPWQMVGQAKLVFMATSPFAGAVLGYPVGFGKTVTALVAALKVHRSLPKARRAFILVLARKSCVPQWQAEVDKHFKPDAKPRTMVLHRADTPIETLLAHDIVICSQGFLRSRYIDTLNPNPRQLKQMPLHSALYQRLGRQISVLIVDESADARNSNTILAHAIRSLTPRATFCLTGTLVYNRWQNIYSQISLLPGCPFTGIEHFNQCFGLEPDDRISKPSDDSKPLLQRLLVALVVARPKSLLVLPKTHVHTEHVYVEEDPEVELVKKIKDTVNIARKTLKEASKTKRMRKKRNKTLKAFRLLRRAQCRASSKLLLWTIPMSEGEEDKDNNKDEDEEVDEDVDPVNDIVVKQEEDTEEEDGVFLESRESRSQLHLELFGYLDPDFIYTQDDEDDTYVGRLPTTSRRASEDIPLEDDPPEEEEADSSSSEDSYTKSTKGRDKRGRGNPEYDAAWLHHIETASDTTLFAPRVSSITEKILTIRRDYPDDKTIVSSQSVKFLDILSEALRRKVLQVGVPPFNTAHFSGLIPTTAARFQVIKSFNEAGRDPWVLFLSTEAGGTGLNIAGANHLIISEPLWSSGQEQQLKGRIERMPQPKEMHIYHFIAAKSEIDIFFNNVTMR
ncbi:P-loop containing nucleoside triphosphate hydrolase protein [Coniochaeta sp. 2T2.1]|nr:P-loop containing nucleoside triphosphate hydrolase protein [Coniochaeta sp. 2T2.1]